MPHIDHAKISDILRHVYHIDDVEQLATDVIEAFFGDKAADLSSTPSIEELWSEKDAVLITYGNSLMDGTHKPLDILHDFLLERMSGVINNVHILPFFPYTSDDGFAVTDFRKVDHNLGDWSDINRISADFNLMSDLVLNHMSSQSPWFNEFRQDNEPYNKFFFTAPKDADVSAVVRPRTTPLLQEVQTTNGIKHVWCTFSHDQVDLDYSNPEVLLEIIRIIRLHIEQGVKIIRLDAVAFLWKQIGTPSIHMPQTHAVIQLIRQLIDMSGEGTILITETNVPKAENLSYFGQSNEAHMIYNFPLPPLILHAMLSGSSQYLRAWQASMPPAPPNCTYFNFTASHDGIGMRPVEGLLPEAEKDRMIDTIREDGGLASMRTGPNGEETVYELNCGYFDALARTFTGETSQQFERFITSQTIVMSLEGMPAFYIHSMLATPNDHAAVKHRGMNRAINRHRWNYDELSKLLDAPDTTHAKALNELSRRLKIRAKQAAFHPNATQFTLNLDDRILGVWRQSQDRQQSIFALHNLSADKVQIPLSALNLIADENWHDLLSGEGLSNISADLCVEPYQCVWLTNIPSKD